MDGWDYTDADYQEAIEDYDRLLRRPVPTFHRSAERFRWHEVEELHEPTIRSELREILVRRGFRPIARLQGSTVVGERFTSEAWVDRAGVTKVEYPVSAWPERPVSSKYYISSYLSNGQAITLWPSDSDLGSLASPWRTNLSGTGVLDEDLDRFLEARTQLTKGDARALLMVDKRTLKLMWKLHALYIRSEASNDFELQQAWVIFYRPALIKAVVFYLGASALAWFATPPPWRWYAMGLAVVAAIAQFAITARSSDARYRAIVAASEKPDE